MSLPFDIDPGDLTQTGWGVVFSDDVDPAVVRALRPLLELRKQQAGKRYQQLRVAPGESVRDFLWNRHGMGPGTIDPRRMPYYLLLVGDPETIPFEFQYQLNVSHVSGRLAFDDVAEYAAYAKGLVVAETRGVDLPRRAVLASVSHPGDRGTEYMADRLVDPLARRLISSSSAWTVERTSGQLDHARLGRLMGGEETPGLLFVTCHGLAFPAGHKNQRRRQGALVCSDWPGPRSGARIERGSYFSDADLGQEARLHGLVAFLQYAYSAGTPLLDEFLPEMMGTAERKILALNPFVNRLAQRLLSHPEGGALAVVGRVERTWLLEQPGDHQTDHNLGTFEEIFGQLFAGARIGHALRPLAQRYVELTAHLSEVLQRVQAGEEVPEELLAFLWTSQNEARNTILLGDPAVRLRGGRV